MFGCLPLDGPHREGDLLTRTADVLALKSHNLDNNFLVRAPNFGDPAQLEKCPDIVLTRPKQGKSFLAFDL